MIVVNAKDLWKIGGTTPTETTGVFGSSGKRKMSEYEGHRYWLLHELRRCRAQGRLGQSVKSEKKALQKELAKLRRIR